MVITHESELKVSYYPRIAFLHISFIAVLLRIFLRLDGLPDGKFIGDVIILFDDPSGEKCRGKQSWGPRWAGNKWEIQWLKAIYMQYENSLIKLNKHTALKSIAALEQKFRVG